MKKNLKYGVFCLFVISALFAACKRDVGEKRLVSQSSVKFDFSNAKALAAVKSAGSSKSVRAASSDSPLLKIMKDGSTELAINAEGSNITLAKPLAIIPSPKENSKDTYIVFDNLSSWKDTYVDEDGYEFEKTHYLGQLLYVHEDGTVVDILEKAKPDESGQIFYSMISITSEKNYIHFDKNGNAYYMTQDADNGNQYNIICKFEPSTNKVTQLSSKVKNLYFDNFYISSDAQYLIVSAKVEGNSTKSFIKYIPINNPTNVGDIVTIEGYDSFEYYYDFDNDIIYYYGDITGEHHWNLYISKRTSSGYEKLHLLQDGDYNQNNPPMDIYEWNPGVFEWNPELDKTEKKLDFFFELCDKSVEKEIRLDKFFEIKHDLLAKYVSDFAALDSNEKVIAWLDESPDHLSDFYSCWAAYTQAFKPIRSSLVFKKGTGETAYNSALDDFHISFNKLFFQYTEDQINCVFTNEDGLWEFFSEMYNGEYTNALFQLTDKNGNLVLKSHDLTKLPIPKGRVINIQQKNNKLYAAYSSVNNNGEISGYHHIIELDLNANQAKDLFNSASVPNKDSLKVISFSAGKNKLYFSALNGSSAKNGSIDLLSNTYAEVSNAQSFNSICSFE